MLRFCSLGSGSTGNATLIEARSGHRISRVLVDCGFSLRELDRRLARAAVSVDDIDGVFVTHEHGDHVGCALTLSSRHRIPLWMSRGTWRAIGEPEPTALIHFARDLQPLSIGEMVLTPYTVPHDAGEPLQLRISDGSKDLGLLTDAGSMTAHLLAQLQGCAGLVLECNHDRDLLANSSYPTSLKRRIGGRLGHLANDESARILAACLHDGLQHLVAAHLSERNNRADLVHAALAPVLGDSRDLVIADPLKGFDWLEIR